MKETWKTRLRDGIKANGKSQREVSMAAGMGPGYVNSLLNENENKDPTVDHLIRVVDAAGLSLYYVLYGVKVDKETEEIIRRLQQSPQARASILQLLPPVTEDAG